ncbi:zinc-binding dehydrogenase [Phytophthora cinnamomi]|uniref:zinc-binding dehydrogenase n=1 Tax=Phytophthora cinnamomi TaxID=4785 RepID=UPI003559AE63|nr:zinc-binding dehydrogenase [Phytophthora cinnamomi]
MRVVVNPMKTPSNIGCGGAEGAFTQELLLCVNRANVKAGDKVVIFGCGPIGLGMLLWLVDRGVTDVVALDLAEERLERARALGVRAAFDPTKVNLREELANLHGEVPSYNRLGVGTDAFIDAAGAPNILSDVVGMAKYHSRMVITAAYRKPLQFPVGNMLTSEMTITTAVGYPTEMSEVMATMPRLKTEITSLISHRLAF